MDVALLIFLILLNGVFAMSEMALAASRKARLQVMVAAGEPGAQQAMELHDNPTRFLSTVQIGITSIGVMNGIVGDAAFSGTLAQGLIGIGIDADAAPIVATGLVVLIITVLTIIFGELVPKRLGQSYPEIVARIVSRPMALLSSLARPLVWLLSFTTDACLRLLGIRGGGARSVTEEEIAASLEEGAAAGIIEASEHQMVRNVFRLDDRQIGSMMIPRAEIVWLDVDDTIEHILARMVEHGHTRYPVCRGGIDNVIGVVSAHRLLEPLARGSVPALNDYMVPPVFVPETLSGMELISHLRTTHVDLVFVVDEYGAVQGVISERDLLEAIAGELGADVGDELWAVQREDRSWLMDGMIPVHELKDRLALKSLPEEDRGRYNTLAGMIMLLLGRLPETTDAVEWEGWRFEVIDLDGKRVDKVLVSVVEDADAPLAALDHDTEQNSTTS